MWQTGAVVSQILNKARSIERSLNCFVLICGNVGDQRCGPNCLPRSSLCYLPHSWFVPLVYLVGYYIRIRVLACHASLAVVLSKRWAALFNVSC
jgi:hypothetical protein